MRYSKYWFCHLQTTLQKVVKNNLELQKKAFPNEFFWLAQPKIFQVFGLTVDVFEDNFPLNNP
jgi:hypothetical protein